MEAKSAARWPIVFGTIIVQMGLGTIYTWSLFNQPLVERFGWNLHRVAITFAITSFALALSTLFAGRIQERTGIRKLVAIAGVVLGAGLVLSSQASSLWLIYLLIGVIVGWADGTAYITSLSNLIRWFPSKKGLISGISVGAYGTGSLVFKYINSALIHHQGVSRTFMYWGLIAMAMILCGSMLLKDAGKQTVPAGQAAGAAGEAGAGKDYTVREMLRTKEAYLLFIILFTACMSGLFLIGIVKDIGVHMAKLNLSAAGSAVAMIAIANTLGRVVLGALSDKVGRMNIICGTMLVTTGAVSYLSFAELNFATFFVSVAAVAFCFGGNITVFPAIVGDYFGLRNHSKNYGVIYQGFGLGALSGSFIAALLGGFKTTFIVVAVLCIISFVIAVLIEPPADREAAPKEKLKLTPHKIG